MNNRERLNAIDRLGEALAALGEGDVTLAYTPRSHPAVRYGVLLRGPYGGTYVASAESPSKAFVKACIARSEGTRDVAA